MVLMTVISCRRREKPVVSMSTSSSSIRRAARTRRLYKRCAGPRGKQAWRGPGSSEGVGGPFTPFSSRLPPSIPNARGASTPTNPRASDRRSSDNETPALPKRQSQDVADSSSRHEAQVRGNDVHTRQHTSPAGIGSAAEPGGWPAGGGGHARQDKLVQAVLSEHADLGALHGSRRQPRQPAIQGCTAQPTIAKISGKREQGKARKSTTPRAAQEAVAAGRLGCHAWTPGHLPSRTAPALRRSLQTGSALADPTKHGQLTRPPS